MHCVAKIKTKNLIELNFVEEEMEDKANSIPEVDPNRIILCTLDYRMNKVATNNVWRLSPPPPRGRPGVRMRFFGEVPRVGYEM